MFERLTIRTDICDDIVYHNPNDPEGMYNILDLAECLYSGNETEAGILLEISRRLAAYEDSGLSPEQVQKLAKAKAEGRLVVMPAKVGDTIYRPEATQYSWEIVSATIYRDEIIFTDDSDNIFSEKDIGKTVFLTREEAEKAIDQRRAEREFKEEIRRRYGG